LLPDPAHSLILTRAVPTKVLTCIPVNAIVRLCCDSATTPPPLGVKTKTPGAMPAETTHLSLPVEEIEALLNSGGVAARFVGSAGLSFASTGIATMICATLALPTERGHDTTKVSVASDGLATDGLTCTGAGVVINA